MGTIRPSAIVIDKDKTERIALIRAIFEDDLCWKDCESGRYQSKCQLLLCWFHAKKAWVENLLPKLPEDRQNELYKYMCNMLEVVTEEDFNEVYGRFKTTYANDAGVLKYVEKGWAGNESLWRLMWPRWMRMFRHGHANTTNLVERMWEYVKYTLLDGKVNMRLDELIIAIVGHPKTGLRFGGLTLVEHYDDAHNLSESRKYVRRGGDRTRTKRLQRAKQLVQRYRQDPLSNLEVIDECHLKFSFRSQTNLAKWYVVSLENEWCECNDYGPICKHMWALKTIVEEDLQHLQEFLPRAYEPHGFVTELNQDDGGEDGPEDALDDAPEDGPKDGPEDGPEDGPTGGPENGQNDGVGVIEQLLLRERLLQIARLTTTKKLEALTAQQYEIVNNATQSFITILQGTMDVGARPSQIPMPRAGGSINPIQVHVTNTRLGHGRPMKKRKFCEEEVRGQKEA
jgi:hypothetical protein